MKIFKQTAVALACAFFLPMTHAASQIDYEIQPYADVILGVFHSEKVMPIQRILILKKHGRKLALNMA